jgi:hypothetical protein
MMSPVATRVKVRTGTVVAGIPVVDDTPTVPPVVAPVVGAASIAVVAVGPGFHSESGQIFPVDAKIGDKVMFLQNVGVAVLINGMEHILFRNGDLLGKMV